MHTGTSTTQIKAIHDLFQRRQTQIVSLTRSLVEEESPSGDEAGSRGVVELLVNAASGSPVIDSIDRIDVPHFGQHLIIRAFSRRATNGNILLVGHTDTVHPRGSLAERPWREEGNRIYGPGVFDMKASCAVAIALLHACAELEVVPDCGVILALMCDEEVGSASGWAELRKIATTQNVKRALILEPPAPGGRVKTGRKGTGIFRMTVTGKAAHAGLDPEKGASAILELARQIVRLNELNDRASGVQVNVGVIQGGTRGNVVAAEASAEIDVRFTSAEQARTIEEAVLNSKAHDARVSIQVSGGINRPPLERTAAVLQVYELARSIARSLEFELGETQVGGASDGNFLAALGIPVLDGLGIDGDGAHANHEHIIVDDIPRRGALLAGLISNS